MDFWYRADVLGTTHNILSAHDGSDQWGLNKDTGDNLNLFINNPGTIFQIASGPKSIQDLEWHHIAFIKVGGTPDYGLYIDGGQTASSVDPDGPPVIPGALQFGAKNSVSGVVGKLSDLRISKSNTFDASPSGVQTNLHYKCNDNLASTVVNDFGSAGVDGTLTAGNTEDYLAPGKINKSFSMSSGGINTNNLAGFTTNTTGTMAMWIYPITNTLGTGQILMHCSRGAAGTATTCQFRYTPGTDRVEALMINGGTDEWHVYSSNNSVPQDTWTHVALVQDGTQPDIYINGVVDNSARPTTTDETQWFNNITATTDTFFVCGGTVQTVGPPSWDFDGYADDIRYFNFALSQAQITTLYNSGIGTEGTFMSTISVPTSKHIKTSRDTLILPMDTHDYSGDGENG
jgi:hypothetical protein